MKTPQSIAVLVVCFLALFALDCNQQKPAPDTRAVDEAALREADVAWSKASETGQVDPYVVYLLDDAVVLGPNEPIANGKESIRKMVAEMFAMPGFGIKWQPTKVEVARSGDIGYSIGTYELSMNGPKGKPMADRGKYATIWKKQADGSWKVAVDMFNSDMPMPQPPTK